MTTKTPPQPPAALPSKTDDDLVIALDVEPRKPRLAWQGMERQELAGAVPTQVVEIVRPRREVVREGELDLTARVRDELVRPENRLIWTNDNLVALQTLLDERDSTTNDYRYRGKINLVYIDPPFMVNNDFRIDNAIDIELDKTAHVQARKEPSLVEIIAYKDTWRRGLDSFLSMLRARLMLLKQLLAPTGSICVHLDWHAVHYVKVLMDQIFGYENFRNEIAWRRTASHSDAGQLGRCHDTLLSYAAGEAPFWSTQYVPYDAAYIQQYYRYTEADGRKFMSDNLTGQGGGPARRFGERGELTPPRGRHWMFDQDGIDLLLRQDRIYWTKNGVPRLKQYLDEADGIALTDIWDDVEAVRSWHTEKTGFPTQKPVSLVQRFIGSLCPPDGLVLDCFLGSGTTAEAAERSGRRWIGIDNGKYAIHLTRKRLIELHGQPCPPKKPRYEYVECKQCKNIERKEKPHRSLGPYQVRPFSLENMGVYQRASEWQGFQQHRTAYRDEMIRVFGGEPVEHSPLLHGRKGNAWIHIGPLDAPVSSMQVWSIAREVQRTKTKAVTVLSADFDTLSASEKEDVQKKTGVSITIRIIPASAIDEVKRRLELRLTDTDVAVESTAIPAFYAPLSIVLDEHVSGRNVEVKLKRCEVDIESFIASQRPMLKPVREKMTDRARKKALGESERWEKREAELKDWLKMAKSWQSFVDFWSVDWNYGRQVGEDGKPIFVAEWQSFRSQEKGGSGELTFVAKFAYSEQGVYRIAARITDVFGNDGIATIRVEVER